jgi:hypothetical protein
MDALMGGANTPEGAAEGGVSKEEFERTKHELDNNRGRLKALDSRLKELEKENAELRAAREREDIISSALTDEERAKVDPEFLKVMAKMNAETEARLRRENEERERQSAEERNLRAEQAKQDFVRRVEDRFPGFLASVGAGGANAEAWSRFYGIYGASIASAYSRFDLDALSHFINMFNLELGNRVPSGSQGAATGPDPRNLGSGAPVGAPTTKTYTEDEITALFDKKEAARDRGDWAEVRRLTDEINRAQESGGAKQ